MRRFVSIGALLFLLIAAGRVPGGEPGCWEPEPEGILRRWHPVGGWDPDGGGLLHWWNSHCFPRSCGPDDYCRKPFPEVCWPACPACSFGLGNQAPASTRRPAGQPVPAGASQGNQKPAAP